MHRVLIVDDHALMREALAAVVRDVAPGAALWQAASAAHALALASQQPLDAALVDRGLPDGQARWLLARLQRHGPALPVLVLLPAEAPAEAARWRARGAAACCALPAGHGALADALRRLLPPPAPARWQPPDTTGWPAERHQVLQLLCAGHSNQDIGRQLGLAAAATQTHVAAIFHGLGVRHRSQAVAAARAAGLAAP